MEEEKKYEAIHEMAFRLMERGFENQFIENQLLQNGVEKKVIEKIIDEMEIMRHEINSKKRRRGFLLLTLGFFLFSIGFILSLMIHDAESSAIMFVSRGISMIGAVAVMFGLVNLFAW
jgi:uncharacterized membrane protein